ncbi:RHS repeat-associated core domain-containing protein [Kitasatospora sp. NPDC004799]|uniref:RHS repeat-associated core domain-containing protein n=1 Tax=Kitasatospora sp. NPDC004799 TaxID=3154460 RepID=UPI0033B5374A
MTYAYDATGCLTKAADDTGLACATRTYAFDRSSNRVNRTSVTEDCDPATADAVTRAESHGYDTADRLTDAGYAYDAFGRTTALPKGTRLGYHTDDLVRTETFGEARRTWDLDAAGRLAAATTETEGADGTWTVTGLSTRHYDGDTDSPAWTREATGESTRHVKDLSSLLTVATGTDSGAVLLLTDLHGDVSVQMSPDGPQDLAVYHHDEYGNTVDATSTTAYRWHGGAQRESDGLSGLTLMGVRAYDPTTGRFLQTDPVLSGSRTMPNRGPDVRHRYASAPQSSDGGSRPVDRVGRAAAQRTCRQMTDVERRFGADDGERPPAPNGHSRSGRAVPAAPSHPRKGGSHGHTQGDAPRLGHHGDGRRGRDGPRCRIGTRRGHRAVAAGLPPLRGHRRERRGDRGRP